MGKKIFLVIFIMVSVRVFISLALDDNTYKKTDKNLTGKITNLVINENKSVIDINRKYRVTLYKKVNYNLGDVVNVKGTFTQPNNNTIPNLFNYRKYLLSKKIKMISSNAKIKVIKKNTNVFYKVKNIMIKKASSFKSEKYVKTFILGDTSGLNEKVKQAYREIGISHLFAISGMHVGIFLFILNKILKKFKYKNLIIFLFLLFFLFLTNFSESLLRVIMFLFLSWINKRFKFGIKNETLIVLTFCALVFLNPYLIYNVGFIFSIVITFFIILSSSLLTQKNYVKKTFFMSVICFLASIPILAFSFFKINLLSVIYNVIFVPLISFLYFPLAMVTFIFPIFDEAYYYLTNILEWLVLNLYKIKLLTLIVSKPNIIIIILYYVLLFLSIKKNKKFIIFFLIILIINVNSRFFINNPEITFLDVGQGDSIVFILPYGKAFLIDTGGVYKNEGAIVNNKTIPYLNSRGISKLEMVILSHGDYDHMADSIDLINNFKVEEVIFNNDSYNELEKRLIKKLEEKNIKYYKNVKDLNINNFNLYFLNTKRYDNENDNSNVIYFDYNNYKFLFMGDAGKTKEKDILKKYNLNNIDFLKVAHHGSDTSSSKEFINQINTKYSVISVGKNNRYNHPKQSVLDILSKSKIYRTDLNGSIMLRLNHKLKIRTYAP